MTDEHDPRREQTFEPEGFRAAWKRFVNDIKAMDIQALSHSVPNLGAELFGELGLPRRAGKVLVLFLIACFLTALIVY